MKPTPEQLNTIAGGLLAIDRSQMEDAARDVWELVAPLVLEAAAREFEVMDADEFYAHGPTRDDIAGRIRALKGEP